MVSGIALEIVDYFDRQADDRERNKLIYGDRGSFDVVNRAFDKDHMIISSSESLDEDFPPEYAYIL